MAVDYQAADTAVQGSEDRIEDYFGHVVRLIYIHR